ncbi:MAG: acyl-CoA dehydratase activase [Candidatus Theseobacter exili]|nr:acyl-CoA dehydratase activase [Candidatus Theseobacter exili]
MIIGIDFGSRNVKIVFLDAKGKTHYRTYSTISFYRNYIEQHENNLVLSFTRMKIPETSPMQIISTGYGKNRINVQGGQTISELIAHSLGTAKQTKMENFINLDMGGQDFKVVLVKDGLPADMQTNPRCAASSGRFLENMARILEISIKKLGQYWKNPIPISSTCAVFAESELVALLSRGMPRERIAAGVNLSLVQKTLPYIEPFLKDNLPVVITGGCAKNQAIIHMFKEKLQCRIIVPARTMHIGAIGCIAYKKLL